MRKLKNSNVERYLDLVKEMGGNGEGQGGEEMDQFRRGGSLPRFQGLTKSEVKDYSKVWGTRKKDTKHIINQFIDQGVNFENDTIISSVHPNFELGNQSSDAVNANLVDNITNANIGFDWNSFDVMGNKTQFSDYSNYFPYGSGFVALPKKYGGSLPKAQSSTEIDADGNIFMSQTTPINQQVVTSTSTEEDKKIVEKNRKQLIANSPTVEIAEGLFKNKEEKNIEIKNRENNKAFNEEWEDTLDEFGNLDVSKVKNWSDEQAMHFYEQNKHDYLKSMSSWNLTPDKVRDQINFYETDILYKNLTKPFINTSLWLGETAVNSFSDPLSMATTVGGGVLLNKAIPFAGGLFNKIKNSKYKGQTSTHTYNPKTRSWIENNANVAKQNLLQNDVEFLVKQNYLINKINTLQQSKIKIVADIKKFKLNNPNKPIPEDLLQVQRINTNQLIAYNKQLANVPPEYTNFLTDGKKWVGPTLKSGNDDIVKRLNAELKLAEEIDLKRIIGDYKWDNRNIFKKYFDTPKHPFNINSTGEKPFWVDYKEGGSLPKAQDGFNFNKSNSYDFNKSNTYGQGRNFFEKEPMTWTNQEIMDAGMDIGAAFHPGFDFAHAFTKAKEGKFTDAALYAAFGILPFSAGPLVRGTKNTFNSIKNYFKNNKLAKELSKNLDAAPLGNTASKVDEKIIPVKNTDTSKDAVLSTKQIQKSIAHEKFVKQSDIFKSNVPLTRVLNSKGLKFENGKLFSSTEPHFYPSTKQSVKLTNRKGETYRTRATWEDDFTLNRNTTHWSHGHIGGKWGEQSTAIINNYDNLKKSGYSIDFDPTDTYFYTKGNFEIPNNSLILTRDKKLYNQIKKETNITNIKLFESTTDDEFVKIVNSYGSTGKKGSEVFTDYLEANWKAGKDVSHYKPASDYKPREIQGDYQVSSDPVRYKQIKEGHPDWSPEKKMPVDPYGAGVSKLHYEDPLKAIEEAQSEGLRGYHGLGETHILPLSGKQVGKLEILVNLPKQIQINEMDKFLKIYRNKPEALRIQNRVAELNGFKSYKEFKNSVDMTNFKKYGGDLPRFQTKGEYPAHIKSEREKKVYDQAMSRGWLYDTRLPNSGYFFTQDALDKALEKAGFNQTTHYDGRKLNDAGLLTLDQTQGDRMSFSYNKKNEYGRDLSHYVDSDENDRMMKLINTGNWGYNPSTGQMVELNKPTKKQLTATQHVMDTEEFGELTTGFGSSGNYNDEQQIIFDNLSKADQKIVKGLSKDQRKKWVANSMQEVYKNPITYAPGALFFGAFAGPSLLTAGSTDLIGGVAGTSVFDALGYYGAYYGIKHGPEDVKEFIDDPSLSTGFDVAMDGLGIFGGGVSAYRGLGNLTKANKLYTSAVSPTNTPVLRATTFNKHGQIKTSFDDQLKVVNKSGYNEVVMEGKIPARDRLYSYHNGYFDIKVRGNQSIPNNPWNVQITSPKGPDAGFMQLVKSEKGVYHLDMSMKSPMDAGQAIKYLSEYVPKGAIIKTAPNGSLSLDSYKLMTNQIKHGKFSYVPSDRTVQLNMMSKNMAKIDVNNAGMVTKTEADEIVKNVNKMLDKAGIKQRATATNVSENAKDVLNYPPSGPQSLENFLTWKVEVPELAIKVKFKEGGEVVKHTIVKGDTGKRLKAMYGTELKDILKHNDLTYFKLGAEIEIPKFQDKGQWNPTDPDTPFTYEDLYGEDWENIIEELKVGEQKVYPWQGSSIRNQTSTGKDPTYWNEDGSFKTADQLIMSTNKQFANFKPKKNTTKIVNEDIKQTVGNEADAVIEIGDKSKESADYNWEADLNIDDQYNLYKDWVTKGDDRPLTTMEKHGFTFAQQDFIGEDERGRSLSEVHQPTEWSDEKYQSDLTSMNQGNNTGFTWTPNLTLGEQHSKFIDFITQGEDRVLTKKEQDIFKALRDNSGEYQTDPAVLSSRHGTPIGTNKGIMFGDAFGLNPEGSGYLGGGIFNPIMKSMFSKPLEILSTPASLVAEGLESYYGWGDGEFNFTDALPNLGLSAPFTNYKGEEGYKRSSDIIPGMEDAHWLPKFAVDLFTDPLTYLTAGTVGTARSAVRSSADDLLRTTVRSSDDLLRTVGKTKSDDLLKTSIKSSDNLLTTKSDDIVRGVTTNKSGQIKTSFDNKLTTTKNVPYEKQSITTQKFFDADNINVSKGELSVGTRNANIEIATDGSGKMRIDIDIPTKSGLLSDGGDMVLQTTNKPGVFDIHMSMRNPKEAYHSIKYLEEFMPKGSVLSTTNFSTDSYTLMLNRLRPNSKFTYVDDGGKGYVHLSQSGKAQGYGFGQGWPKDEALIQIAKVNKQLEKAGIPYKAKLGEFMKDSGEYLIDIPNVMIKLGFKLGGEI